MPLPTHIHGQGLFHQRKRGMSSHGEAMCSAGEFISSNVGVSFIFMVYGTKKNAVAEWLIQANGHYDGFPVLHG